MNELDQKDYWYPRKRRKKKIENRYVQSQWRVVLLWYYIFWQSSTQRGRHTQLCIITSLKWIIQICSNFYCWVCKIVFYSPNQTLFGETSPLKSDHAFSISRWTVVTFYIGPPPQPVTPHRGPLGPPWELPWTIFILHLRRYKKSTNYITWLF